MRHCLGEHDMEVIRRVIGDAIFDWSGEEDDPEEGDQGGDADDASGGELPNQKTEMPSK